MSMNGIDISNHQAGLNLAAVPCDFVICKATEGTSFVDKYCDGFIQKALSLGKKIGVYHFATGRTSGRQEAEFFYQKYQRICGQSPPGPGLGRKCCQQRRGLCEGVPGSPSGADRREGASLHL